MTLEELIESKINEVNSPKELAFILENLIAYHSLDLDDKLYSIRALVDNVAGLRIEIFSNEHAPPHFHIRANGINAVFSISDCSLIQGEIGDREYKMIKWWYRRSRKKLIEFWNNTRPSDCKVGSIVE